MHTPDSTHPDNTSIVISATFKVSSRPVFRLPEITCADLILVPGQGAPGQELSFTLAGRPAYSCQALGTDFIVGKSRALGVVVTQVALTDAEDTEYVIIVAHYQAGADKAASISVVKTIAATLALH